MGGAVLYELADCRDSLRQVFEQDPKYAEASLLDAGLRGRMGDARGHLDILQAAYDSGQAQVCTERWLEAARLDDGELQRAILGDQVDVLIDLAGHTSTHRQGVFALRAAPVHTDQLTKQSGPLYGE